MIPTRSTPNLRDISSESRIACTVTSYLQTQPGLHFIPVNAGSSSTRDEDSPPPTPPVRDSSSLKSIKYGPGHEKFPSWPVPATAETPQALRNSNGGSHRSKSWTDHTNYPKEKVVAYTRPYMKRQFSVPTQQKLKTVMEKCEKILPETYETRYDRMNERVYLPHVNHDGKSIEDMDYVVPSPPERDLSSKSDLSQEDLEAYARSYQEPNSGHLTESGLEEFMEYTRSYDDSLFSSLSSKHENNILTHMHQKQISYAQSEGYHSYVSSTDSTSTPFLDRLRRDSEAVLSRPPSFNTWSDINCEEPNMRPEGRDSVVTTSSGSASSSETLKWHGSMSDVSVTSHSSSHLANSSSSTRQLIVHSARVQTPQRHHSESVLYMTGVKDCSGNWKYRENKNNNANKLKLFPINTYTVQETEKQATNNSATNRLSLSLQPALSVADRVTELEKQQKYSYLDPDKKHKIPDPTLKAIQKKALLSFYERHNNNNKNVWRSEPQLNPQTQIAKPQPQPKVKLQMPSRRASSASDYASVNSSKRSSLASNTDNHSKTMPRHQHSNSCSSLLTDALGPMIVGPSISVDDWIPEKPPERPPKNPYLRTVFPDLFQEQRVPSPDLPLPSPPTIMDEEVFNNDEPLPPPPPELDMKWPQEFNSRYKENVGSGSQMVAAPQVQSSVSKSQMKHMTQTLGLPEHNFRNSYASMDSNSSNTNSHRHESPKPHVPIHSERRPKPDTLGFPNQRGYQERSSARYPTAPKISLAVASSQKVVRLSEPCKPEPLRPHNREEVKKHPVPLSPGAKPQRASIAESSPNESPPPLKPRQMRVNQSMRVRGSNDPRLATALKSSHSGKDLLCERSSSMSQSKASYLAHRRDRDRIAPDSEIGSYKRTMSPNGHALPQEESQRLDNRETIWPLNKLTKDTRNNIVSRRSSLNDRRIEKCDEKEDLRKQLVLPDVLPINVKLAGPRSQEYKRPTQLNSTDVGSNEICAIKSSPKSPMKSPSSPSPRGSPLSSSNVISSFVPTSTATTVAVSSAVISTPTVKFSLNVLNSAPITKTPVPSPPLTPSRTPTRTPPTVGYEIRSLSMPANTHKSNSNPSNSPTQRMSPITPPTRKTSPPLIKPALSPNYQTKLSPVATYPKNTTSQNKGPSISISPLPSPKSSPPHGFSPLTLTNITTTKSSTSTSPSTSPVPKSPTTTDSPPPIYTSKSEDYPKVIEGLQMIQRTEVVVRVNTSTSDASSQTEIEEIDTLPSPTATKLQEEIECEKLAEAFVDQLPTASKLKELLVPVPEHKKPTDYVQGLFRVSLNMKARPASSPFRSRGSTPSCTPPPSLPLNTVASSTIVPDSKLSTNPSPVVAAIEPTSPLSESSTYFTTSEPKAKFLTRYGPGMNDSGVIRSTKDLSQKKDELVCRLGKKLDVLRNEQLLVSDECKINDELGENVELYINRVARPQELAKFRLHVEEVGKITSLLLGLSGRLARAENALMGMVDEHPEKVILECKRDKLVSQLEEAKKLKECIDRRSVTVSNILYKYLSSEEYADYDHFINMKAKLIMDSKEISDKIKLGEEQLLALKETLIVAD